MLSGYFLASAHLESKRAEILEAHFDELAFIARYGRTTPNESMEYPRWFRRGFANAIARLVRDESKSSSTPLGMRES